MTARHRASGAEPRHFLFALTDGGGTVPPELGVVRRLAQRGHRVRALIEGSIADRAEEDGAELHRWRRSPILDDDGPERTAYRDWEIRNPFAHARGMADVMIAGPSLRQAEDTRAQIMADRPDRVVTSFTAFGAMAAAQAADVSFDVLIPNIYPLPVTGLPAMGTGLKPSRTPLGRVRDRVTNAVSTMALGHFALPRINATRERLGLSAVRSPWDQVHAARRQLVLSSRQFEFPAEFPATVRHVGPVLDEPERAGGKWKPPAGSAPLVLVALSSTYQGQESTLQNAIDALSGLPVHGLVTTGFELEPGALVERPGVEVVRSISHASVMEHADLVITHGGHGTVMKALVAGTPMILMPHGRDQPDTAVRVAARGAGLVIPKNASMPGITRAVTHVLASPAYTRAAEKLGSRIREDIEQSALLAELELW